PHHCLHYFPTRRSSDLFKTDKFSIFHSDFDVDSDINVSSSNAFAITNPQIIYDIHSWFTLGRLDRYSDLSKYSVSREAFRNSVLRFGDIFKGCEDRKSTRLNSSHVKISY